MNFGQNRLDKWKKFERFLLLGNETNKVSLDEHSLNVESCQSAVACAKEDVDRAVTLIKDISVSGRNFKQDPPLLALAAISSLDSKSAKAVYSVLPQCLRYGTQVFMFMKYVNDIRGFGTGMRKSLSSFVDKDINSVATQMVKYQNREGWGWRDYLRVVRPEGATPAHSALFRYIVTEGKDFAERDVKGKGTIKDRKYASVDKALIPDSFMAAQECLRTTDSSRAVELIGRYKLTHEMVNNDLKKNPDIWAALLEHMKPEAMLRNLGRMTAIGLVKPLSQASKKIVGVFSDPEQVKKARLHPFKTLIGLKTYEQGHGDKGSLSWSPVPAVLSAMETAFYSGFASVEPTNKNFYFGVDISGSMSTSIVAGHRKGKGGRLEPNVLPISCREGTGVLTMMMARTERNYYAMGFTSGRGALTEIKITPKMDLKTVCNIMSKLPMGGTDCALPMIDAKNRKLEVDSFVVLTDNETWAGSIKPAQALNDYRQATGRPAKLIVVAMAGTDFTIADPEDPESLDIVGMDSSVVELISNFSR